MNWLSLLRRAWTVWQQHRHEFVLCKDCSMPLTPDEEQVWQSVKVGPFCTECHQLWVETQEVGQAERRKHSIQGAFATLVAPGLGAIYPGKLWQTHADELRNQHLEHMQSEQMQQQMNMLQNDALQMKQYFSQSQLAAMQRQQSNMQQYQLDQHILGLLGRPAGGEPD